MNFFNKYKDLFEIPQVSRESARDCPFRPHDYASTTNSSSKNLTLAQKHNNTHWILNSETWKKTTMNLKSTSSKCKKWEPPPDAASVAKAALKIHNMHSHPQYNPPIITKTVEFVRRKDHNSSMIKQFWQKIARKGTAGGKATRTTSLNTHNWTIFLTTSSTRSMTCRISRDPTYPNLTHLQTPASSTTWSLNDNTSWSSNAANPLWIRSKTTTESR